MLLVQSIHGSRLYNLNHEHSDYDYWKVETNKPKVKSRQITHKVKDGLDVTCMDLSTFSKYADSSSHQVLELMFSAKKSVCLIKEYCDNFYVNPVTFRELYWRTIKAFNHGRQRDKNEIKTVRHTVRMALNLEEGLKYGRFNPTLDDSVRHSLFNSSIDQLET